MRKKKKKGLVLVCVVFFQLAFGFGASELKNNKATHELEDIFLEGKSLFFSEVRLKFGIHPLKFTLCSESIKTIQEAEEKIPFLYENLIEIVSTHDKPYYESLIEMADQGSITKLRKHFSALCQVAADCFVQSLFQEKSRMYVEGLKTGTGNKTRLELVLESISNGETQKESVRARHTTEISIADFTTQWGFRIVKLDHAQRSTRGKGVRIAVIDENGHGTVTASLVAAAAPEAEMFIYKIGYDQNPIFPYWTAYQVAASIQKAVHSKADVILVSSIFDRDYEFLKDACQFAYENNVFIVCPNGTSFSINPALAHQFPAHYNTTVAVAGAVPDAGKKPVLWDKTSASHYTTVSAPVFMDDESVFSGNSWAAAVTAGVAALIMSRIPKSGKELHGQYFQRIYEILTKSASPYQLGYKSFNDRMGYGLIDADTAVNSGLEAYIEKMKKIEQNFQERMKEREKQQEEKLKKAPGKKDG